MLPQQRATLTLGHATPDAELNPVVEGVGTAFQLDRAVPADRRGLALSRSANEQVVRVSSSAPSLGHPHQPSIVSGGNCRHRHPPTPVCRCISPVVAFLRGPDGPDRECVHPVDRSCWSHHSPTPARVHIPEGLLGESHSALNLRICAWLRNPWSEENGTIVQTIHISPAHLHRYGIATPRGPWSADVVDRARILCVCRSRRSCGRWPAPA